MNFNIDVAEMQRAVKLLGITARVNTTDPDGLILIKATSDQVVSFVSNCGYITLELTSTKVSVETPGIVAIEYGKIKSFITSFVPWNGQTGAKDFNVVLKEQLHFDVRYINENGRSSKTSLKVRLYNPDLIGSPMKFGKPSFTMTSDMFKEAIGKIQYAVDPANSIPFIQGININFTEDHINFVGTDSRMLSEFKLKNNSDIKDKSILLRYDFTMAVRRAITEKTEIQFEITTKDIKAKFNDVCIWGKLIVGHSFPPYKEILASFKEKVIVDREILLNGVRPFLDNLNADDHHRMSISLADHKLKMLADNLLYDYDGEVDYSNSFIIDVDGVLLSKTLNALKDDKILMKFSDDGGVLIFDSANFQDQPSVVTPLTRH